MNKSLFLVLLVLVALVAIGVDAKKTKKKKKQSAPPVEVEDLGDSFSDQEHYHDGGEHDTKYDQDAFLGEDQAKSVENLSPKEVKAKLREIFVKIDVDQDKKVSRKELREWIVDNMNKHVKKSTKSRFEELDKDKDGKVTWQEYHDFEFKLQEGEGVHDKETLEQTMKTDERRFKLADSNGDGFLDSDELGTFIHPEESPRMTSILVEENIEALDKDGDGLIDFKEYSGIDGTPSDDKETMDSLKQTFNEELDKNKDGKLDKEEVKNWIMPGGHDDPASGETEHLMKSADLDKDNYLTIEEVLQNHETFSGGRVTAYGELLKKEL